jgi:hypothetical protein
MLQPKKDLDSDNQPQWAQRAQKNTDGNFDGWGVSRYTLGWWRGGMFDIGKRSLSYDYSTN